MHASLKDGVFEQWDWGLHVIASIPSSPELKQLPSSQNVGVLLGTSTTKPKCHSMSKLVTFCSVLFTISVSQLPLLFLCSTCLKYSTSSPQTQPSWNFYSCCLLSLVTSFCDIHICSSLPTSTAACCLAHVPGNLSTSHSQISLPRNIYLVLIFLRKWFSQDTYT